MYTASREYHNVFLYKFEDFLGQPESLINSCCHDLELSYSVGIMPSEKDNFTHGKWYPIEKDRNVEQLKEISQEEIRSINDALGDLTTRLGYSLL